MIRSATLIFLASCLLNFQVPAALGGTPPNVLMIIVDDLNDWIGCLNGHPQAHTPNIDRLARRGVLFANTHCVAPACNPSRAAVFSGQRPESTGVYSNSSPRLLTRHPNHVTLMQHFATAGYQTWGAGKILHGVGESKKIVEEGFFPEQRWSPFTRRQVKYTRKELPSKGTSNPRHVIDDGPTGERVVLPLNRMPSDRAPEKNDGESFDWGPVDVDDEQMGDGRITTWAVNKLDADSAMPFFLTVGYYRPHIPLFAPAKYFKRYPVDSVVLPVVREDDLSDLGPTGRKWAVEAVTAGSHQTVLKFDQWKPAVAAYLACIEFVDAQIGRLLDALDAGPHAQNTIIVLWTDHGWHLGEKQHWGKWTGWERSTRVPLMIAPADDALVRRGEVCHQPASLIDLYPTLVDLCDIDLPPHQLAGISLQSLLADPARITGRKVVTTFDKGNHSVRNDRWRYIRYADGSEELYDLQKDPHEFYNLMHGAGRNDVLKDLRSAISQQSAD